MRNFARPNGRIVSTMAIQAIALMAFILLLLRASADETEPAILILDYGPHEATQSRMDYDWLREMHEQEGMYFNVHYHGSNALTWDMVKDYNTLIVLQLPTTSVDPRNPTEDTEVCPQSADVLDRYLAAGGGIFLMPDLCDTFGGHIYAPRNRKSYLKRWGIEIAHDQIIDEQSTAQNPRYGGQMRGGFIYTDAVSKSPVSDGVRGMWFPVQPRMWTVYGYPVWPVDDAWQVVVQGRETSHTQPVTSIESYSKTAQAYTPTELDTFAEERFFSPDNSVPPALFAIREADRGRMAITAMHAIFHIRHGSSWIHNGVVLDNGLEGVPSDFGRLFVNTLRWMAEPSLETGNLGGYVQNPDVITHPHFRKEPEEFFPQFDSYQNPVPPTEVYRGVIGAQTAYSSGEGKVADWAAAARSGGLDFIVFLEDFNALSETDYRRLEAECREHSAGDLLLMPGFTMQTNVGNHGWAHGFDITWPPEAAIDEQGRLAMQDFDDEGKLLYDGQPARRWRFRFLAPSPTNFGYYNFEGSAPGHVPVRNLRLYGMLGVVTYIDGKLVEDVTDSYFKLMPQTNTSKVSAVSILQSPAELEAFLENSPYLTHVAAHSIQDIPDRMRYAHQYGQPSVNLSSGPRIHSWARMHRVLTYAGESFVTGRNSVPVLAKVTSDVGLSEIRIYRDAAREGARLFRRIKLDGQKEYEQVFEWGYDRQGVFVLEAIDAEGGRAVSTSFEMAHDGNWHTWCHDRHNGELWHGPFEIRGTWETGVRNPYSVGYTWDGGGSLTRYMGLNLRIDNPNLVEITDTGERIGDPRRMEGHTFMTCIDDTVRNIAGEAWNDYAPGVVANSYHTYGPIKPSDRMQLRVRRTEYMARVAGPLLDWHAMWSEREGGALALHEGGITLLRDMKLGGLHNVGEVSLVSFSEVNPPVWVVRKDIDETSPQVLQPSEMPHSITIQPGGYIGVYGSVIGSPSMVANVSERPLEVRPFWRGRLLHLADVENQSFSEGDSLEWRLLYIYDSLDHEARNAERMDYIWRYFGLDGSGGTHGLELRRGSLLSSNGLVDLKADNGVVEFTVPEPGVEPALDMPLGVRFFGFNPNWTVGLLQVEGYTPGYHNPDGRNLYRNLGADDKGIAYLAVYTDGVGLAHIVTGHPVVADNEDLRINVVKLADEPARWRVDINNPTDNSIRTTVRVNLPETGIPLDEMEIELGSGEFKTLLGK